MQCSKTSGVWSDMRYSFRKIGLRHGIFRAAKRAISIFEALFSSTKQWVIDSLILLNGALKTKIINYKVEFCID